MILLNPKYTFKGVKAIKMFQLGENHLIKYLPQTHKYQNGNTQISNHPVYIAF